MRLRFLDMAGARCASTVGLSSGAVLGDGVVVRGRGARGRPGLPADSHASSGAGAVVPRLLVQACEVAICCWAVVPRRAAGVYRGGARRKGWPTQGERSLCLKLCVRALRGSCVASSAIQIHCSTQLSSQHHVLGAEESKPLRSSRFACLLVSYGR